MTAFLIAMLILPGRITQWEHFTHFGAVNNLLVEGEHVIGATTGGMIFGTITPDSVEWDSTWTYPGELSHSDCRYLTRDDDNNLWIATYGGGIDVALAGGGFEHYGQLEGLPLGMNITCIIPDSIIYAGTTEGLCIKEHGYFEVFDSQGSGLPNDMVNCMAQVDAGLIVGTAGGVALLGAGAYPGSPDSWFYYPGGETLNVIDLVVSGDSVFAATTSGLFVLKDSVWTNNAGYPGSIPLSISLYGEKIAVGGDGDVCIYDSGAWEQYDDDLSSQMVRDIVWLSETTLVLGQTRKVTFDRSTGNGVAIGEPDSWESSYPAGVPSNDLLTCSVDLRNDVWVGTNDNGIGVLQDGIWTNFRSEFPSRHQFFICIPGYAGGIFTCPYYQGLYWLDWQGTPDKSDDILLSWDAETTGLLNNQAVCGSAIDSMTAWFGQEPYWETPDEASGVCRLTWTPGIEETASWKTFQPGNGLPSGYVNDIVATSTTLCWMATENGLVLGDVTSGRVITTITGLPSVNVTALQLMPTGYLYVGTTAGLAKVEVASGSIFLPSGISGGVNSLGLDNLSCLWVSTTDALFRIYPDGAVEEYNTLSSPLQTLDIRGMGCDSDNGYLYIVTDHGLWKLTLETGMSGELSTAVVYPNPFCPDNSSEILGIAGIPDTPLIIRIFDLTGKLVYYSESAGRDEFFWNGKDNDGNIVAAGTYIIQIIQNEETHLTKLAIFR